ncbi:MAG TPA: circularly permuted type 2 ATP-grasp protein [Mariprofundaceae bacterium]|nr:circularly permuted type 2 ATP-grasp protein [Mariprofundaceae bacterium]
MHGNPPLIHATGAARWDEAFLPDGSIRPAYRQAFGHFEALGTAGVESLQHSADLSMLNQGVTFTVYSDARGTEKIFPFDLMPRIIDAHEWQKIEQGVAQRMVALNLFLEDVYHGQKILKAGVVPTSQIMRSTLFCREMSGLNPPGKVHVHIGGIDLIRNESGEFHVLEDNLRCPSGVSYVIENRWVMGRVQPELLKQYRVRPVDHYPQMLFDSLASLSARDNPTVAVLTPGTYNSAYFEHSFLANQMGAELVEGQDLLVDQDVLYMKTTRGLQRVDVLYLRVDTDFLDPLAFRPDSVLGVPGIMHAYRAGNVALANAPGNGVADDKALYAYTPEIIRYYLDEEPILPIVPTYLGSRATDLRYMLEHLRELVVKPTDASGGYGLLVGSHASKKELEAFRSQLAANPDHYIAQPIQQLSTHPTWVEQDGGHGFFPRHVDLRPFAVCDVHGDVRVLPGGLTRVALRQGSLVVNSSQGGGSKDTWVLYPENGAEASRA